MEDLERAVMAGKMWQERCQELAAEVAKLRLEKESTKKLLQAILQTLSD